MRVHPAIAALSLASLMLLSAGPAHAHQPVVVDSETTEVVDPEISKAYYGVLSGAAHTYVITSDAEFDLYVGILVPDSETPKRDVKAEIFRGDELVESLGGVDAEWVTFYEPFAQNTYWDGGEYRLRAAPGVYTVRISSPDNASKYSLAIGEIEYFGLEDRALHGDPAPPSCSFDRRKPSGDRQALPSGSCGRAVCRCDHHNVEPAAAFCIRGAAL